jgi:hypothetical protein
METSTLSILVIERQPRSAFRANFSGCEDFFTLGSGKSFTTGKDYSKLITLTGPGSLPLTSGVTASSMTS